MLIKKDFDSQLKAAAAANRFHTEGNYIVFDHTANLAYKILQHYTLGDLLTHNPVASYTKLNKDLLLRLDSVSKSFNVKIPINSSYRSPEYNKTVPGAAPNSWHTKGDALDLGYFNPDQLAQQIKGFYPTGEIGKYSWGVHMAVCAGFKEWDTRDDVSLTRKVKDVLVNDDKRNYSLYAVIAAIGLFIFYRIF